MASAWPERAIAKSPARCQYSIAASLSPASVKWWATSSGWARTISGKWVSYALAIRACSCWRLARSRLAYATSCTNACLKVYCAFGGLPCRKSSSARTSCSNASFNWRSDISAAGVQQFVRELAAQRGTDLGHLSHRSQSVKPCHQRVLERRGDRYRCQRTVKHIVMLPFPQQPAFEHCLGQLLDEEWYAVRANKDLVDHLVRQGSTLSDLGYQHCPLASAQSRERDRRHMSITRPGRRKLRPCANKQQ